MNFIAILNRGGGTLRTMDLDAFSDQLHSVLESKGHALTVEIVDGKQITDALDRASRSTSADVILIGGGDGTVSAAAAALKDSGKALAVLPAGTMNLFARALSIPLELDDAIEAFATGIVRKVDVASANGRVFIHQYSVGLHAKMVKERDSLSFASRLGKMGASIRAGLRTILNPPSMRVEIDLAGTEMHARTSGISVSNNVFGEGHIPYAGDPAGGLLGIYVASAASRWDAFRIFADIFRGNYERSALVTVHESDAVSLHFSRVKSRHRCVIDGELSKLDRDVALRIHPGALNVLVPADTHATTA